MVDSKLDSKQHQNISALVIGAGRMGSRWLTALRNEDVTIDGIIDTDTSTRKEAVKFNTSYYNNFTEYVNTTSDFADLWIISCPVEKHNTYLLKAIQYDIDTVLIETPSTETPNEAENALNSIEDKDMNISVNYVELESPAVNRVYQDIEDSEFVLSRAIHWRGEDPPRLYPYVRNDTGHDISEIVGLYDILDRDPSELEVDSVEFMNSWSDTTDQFKDNPNREHYDVNAEYTLTGSNSDKITIRGGFDQPERRYFFWVDDDSEIAYLVNTMNREHLTPFAAKITGKNNIRLVEESVTTGTLRTDDEFDSLLLNVDAEQLNVDTDQDQLDTIISELISGNESPVPLETATLIEQLLQDVYKMSEFDSQVYSSHTDEREDEES